jgi:hypothetical protein
MNGNGLQYSTVITLRDRGDILVERVCQGVVVDKYTTWDLKIPRRSAREWAGWVTAAANTPLGITVPEPTEWDGLSDDMMCELEPKMEAVSAPCPLCGQVSNWCGFPA